MYCYLIVSVIYLIRFFDIIFSIARKFSTIYDSYFIIKVNTLSSNIPLLKLIIKNVKIIRILILNDVDCFFKSMEG
jgi:hypothetical protein